MSDSFDLSGGNNGRSFSFGPQGSQPGAHVTGFVVDLKEVQETHYDGPDAGKPIFWDNGDPKMQLRLTLQTELRDPGDPNDDGLRNVYLNGYKKPHPKTGTSSTIWAVMDAVRAATGGTEIRKGGKVTLQWVSGMGFTGDPRHYQAWYEAPKMDLAGPPQAAQAPVQPMAQGSSFGGGDRGLNAAAPQPDPWATPAQGQPYAPPPAQPVQPVQTEQGMVNPATGEIQQAAAAPQAAAPGPAAPALAGGPTAEQVAALRAAGIDPATVFPDYAPQG